MIDRDRESGVHSFVVSAKRYVLGSDEFEFTCADCGYQCRGGAFMVRAIAASGSFIPELGLLPPTPELPAEMRLDRAAKRRWLKGRRP